MSETEYVALLRGVNVGGHKVPMAELRSLFDALGHVGARTYIQSGNVVFPAATPPDPGTIAAAIGDRFGFAVPVIVRTADELSRVVAQNPFADYDSGRLYVGFLSRPPSSEELTACDEAAFLPERFAFVGSEEYLLLPDGMARTKLPLYLERRVKTPVTIRNWRSVNALVEMCGR